MKVVHFAPFAPNRAGIYEAARDMVRADALAGHDVSFVDTGTFTKTGHTPGAPGQVDSRSGFDLTTVDQSAALSADALVCHSGVPDIWVVKTQAPMIWIVHGRPLACFRPEQNGGDKSYSLIAEIAKWPRSKALVHFWPEFSPYWNAVIPAEKQVSLDFPPIDGNRFSPDGEADAIEPRYRGRYNGLICDSWREDVDLFEVFHGALEAAKRIQGLVWHLYAMESPLGPWEYLLAELRKLGALGQVSARMPYMDRVYRSVDFVLTPHRIVTRVIGESLCCGTPIVAADGCKVTQYTASMSEPTLIADSICELIDDLDNDRNAVVESALKTSELFSLETYAAAMTAVYEKAVGVSPCLR